jgi:competence CoiA-like predicted nuclease
MKERIARAAEQHGLSAEVQARTPHGKVRTDVLVSGPAGRIGWEAQYSPVTATTVQRRSQAAADHDITPLWVTKSGSAARATPARGDAIGACPQTARHPSAVFRAGHCGQGTIASR